MKKGRLTIFLSYTPGAGKSYIMKQWGEQERINGKNVITAFINDMHRNLNDCNKTDTADMVMMRCGDINSVDKGAARYSRKNDEKGIICRKKTKSHKYSLSEIINNNPDLVLLDEMGMGGLNKDETQAAGTQHESVKSHIYDDIDILLDMGIDVYTTANLKRFDGMNPRFKEISGIGIKTTIPDRYLEIAEIIVFVDRSPNALINDFESGKLFNEKYMKSGIMKKNFRKDILCNYRKLSLEILEKYKDKLEIVNNDFF